MQGKGLYWICQLAGWSSYILLAILFTFLSGEELNFAAAVTLFSIFSLGILLSHAYRYTMLRLNWLRLRIAQIIPRILLGSIFFAFLLEVTYASIIRLALGVNPMAQFGLVVQDYGSWFILFLLWSVIYFFYHFFTNYKKEEIINLQWQAAENEMKLKQLRSQLNPHFIFNAMNSIRALVDENPAKAKRAITQLSNLLRSSLQVDRKKFITIGEEIALVRDYLEIEKARYEERLQVEWNVPESMENDRIPPMLMQTLVENSIKHGISKLPSGGLVRITVTKSESGLDLSIENSGSLKNGSTPGTGYGLNSTRERIKILYGEEATFELTEQNETVVAKLHLPN